MVLAEWRFISTKQQLKGWAMLVWALQMETPLTFRTWIDQCLHVPSFLQVNLNSSNIMIDSVIHLCCKGCYRFKPQGSKTLSYSELSFIFFQKKNKKQLILQGDSPAGEDLDDFYPSQTAFVCFIRTITHKCCFYVIKLANCPVEDQTSTGKERGEFAVIPICRRLRLRLSAPCVKADSLTTLWGNCRMLPHNPHTFPQCSLLLRQIRHWNITFM